MATIRSLSAPAGGATFTLPSRTVHAVTEVYVLPGGRISSLDGFWAVVGETMGCGGYFGGAITATVA